jgi:flagellar basal-body rod protein FlgC
MEPSAAALFLGMPASHSLALLVALLVLAMAGMAIAGHRRREREHREHLRALREREQRLRLSLWASNEMYWQYDLQKRELERTRVEPDRTDFKTAYEPGHPSADAKGYVKLPNIDSLVEAMDMREAQRAYEANLIIIETARAMDSRILDLLKK